MLVALLLTIIVVSVFMADAQSHADRLRERRGDTASLVAAVGALGAAALGVFVLDRLRRRRFVIDGKGIRWRVPGVILSTHGSAAWDEVLGAHQRWETTKLEDEEEVRVEWLLISTRVGEDRFEHRVRWEFHEDARTIAELICSRAPPAPSELVPKLVPATPRVARGGSRWLSWLGALVGSAVVAAPGVYVSVTRRDPLSCAVAGGLLLVFPFVFVPLRRRLAERSRVGAIARRAAALLSGGADREATAALGATATVRRGRVRCVTAVQGPSGRPCAAYVAREREPGWQSSVRSAAGDLELETEQGHRVTLTAGAWRVADPFDRTTVVGEARIREGTEVVACGPGGGVKGGGGFRSAAGPDTLAPGILLPVSGAFPYRAVVSRDGSDHVVRAVFVLAAL
ncbi:MAG: hypothetical protein IT373_36710, partial [Polyangiaceae bacterium]|nr:hypothetical protein [Polyangiaceae bacterium]